MSEVLSIVAFLGLIFGLAALILLMVDKFRLRSRMSAEERKAAIVSRTGRWSQRYSFFTFIMALIALFVNAFNLGHESIRWRVGWFVLAALIVLSYLSQEKEDRHE
jgi:hypothetical protein